MKIKLKIEPRKLVLNEKKQFKRNFKLWPLK
jgi:hypothetical protein